MYPQDDLNDEEEQSLPPADPSNIPPTSPEEILARSYSADPQVYQARNQRDREVADATVNQGVTELATALASQGRVKASTSAYDAIKKNAEQRAAESSKDVSLRQKTISDYMKAQAAQKKAAEDEKFKLEGRDIRKGELEEFQSWVQSR